MAKKMLFISTGKSVIKKEKSQNVRKSNYQITFSQIAFLSNINEVYEKTPKL